MTYNEVLSQLRQKEWARERVNRHSFIMDMIEFKYRETKVTDRERIKDFLNEYNSLVRTIQMVQKDNPDTQGHDYNDGKVLAQSKVLELGYSTGYNEFVSNIKRHD